MRVVYINRPPSFTLIYSEYLLIFTFLHTLVQHFPQYLVAQAFDAFQVLQKALEIEPCSSINASKVTTKDRVNLLDCMKEVKCFCDFSIASYDIEM